MRKLPVLLVLCALIALSVTTTAPRAQSAVPVIFQTTFNCPDWRQSMGLNDANVCAPSDGIAGSGAWTTSAGSQDQITAAANNPLGAGGKGFRHWRGDGVNNVGGGIRIDFPPATQMWFRMYIRYQAGFRWINNHNDSK